MRQLQTRISILLIVALLFGCIQPAFSQSNEALTAAYNRYANAYQAYLEASREGADQSVIQQRYQEYQEALGVYRQTAQLPAEGKANETVSQDAATSAQAADGSPVVAATSADSSTQTVSGTETAKKSPMQWFKDMFDKAKQKFTGTPGKEMPLWEKVLWSVGKALVPSFGVMAVTALLAPLSPVLMIVGGIVAGAALGGAMTYAFEKRMNAKYRETPKEDAKIWRDVAVGATVEAVMAPFKLATGGLFGIVGPTVGSAIYRVAATQAVLSFAGSALSSSAGGAVKHLWAKHIFRYPEKIASNEARIDAILDARMQAGTPLTQEEVAELDRLQKEIDQMKAEDYGPDDFKKDMKRAAVSSVISGFVGSVVADRAYTYDTGRWADRLSVRVFGSVAKGKEISSLFSTMPVNFVSGMAGATLEKHFVSQDIEKIKKQQQEYAPGSAGYQYYDGLIKQLQARREDVNVVGAGVDTMLTSTAVRAGQLTVQALKYNFVDAPMTRKRTIDQQFKENDPEWKKAAAKYEELKKAEEGGPDIRRYRNPVNYAKALKEHNAKVEVVRKEWLDQCLKAQEYEKSAAAQAIKADMAAAYDRNMKLNQMIELGRLTGGMAHVRAVGELLKEQNPELAKLPDNELQKLAIQSIRDSYGAKYTQCVQKVEKIETTRRQLQDYKAGRLQLTEAEAKVLEGKVALISPSQYKAALVEAKVYELKNQNVRWDDVKSQMPDILKDAENQMLKEYGGWGGVLGSEMYANGLAKYQYDPEGGKGLMAAAQKWFSKAPSMIAKSSIDTYRSEVDSQLTAGLTPSKTDNDFELLMQSFAKGAITETTKQTSESIYKLSPQQIFNAFNRR